MATALVVSGATAGPDEALTGYLAAVSGIEAVDLFMSYATEIGDVFYMLALAVVLVILRQTRRVGITLLVLLVLGTLITGYAKCAIDRDRPDYEFAGARPPIDPERDTFSLFCDGGLYASYPSGHAARAAIFGVIIGCALAPRFPRGCYLLLSYPAAVALSRVYLLEHYPMDVVGGCILGVLLAGAVGRKTRLLGA